MDNTAQPNVFVPTSGVPTPPPTQPPPSPGQKWLTPKLIFIILGIIVVVEVILSLRSVAPPPSSGGIVNLPTINQSNKGRIALTTDKKEVKVGEVIPVKVEVTAPQSTAGIDVVAKFDPTMLSAIDGDVHAGGIFPRYPLAKVEDTGVVRISGIATPGAAEFVGKDIFATVNFKALKAGTAKITLDFTPGSTADSNIVGNQGKDLLEEVGNLEVNIR